MMALAMDEIWAHNHGIAGKVIVFDTIFMLGLWNLWKDKLWNYQTQYEVCQEKLVFKNLVLNLSQQHE